MSRAITTNKGNALLAKLIQGNTLDITGAKTGSGTVDTTVLREQTDVTNFKQAMAIQSVIDQGNGVCDLVLSLTNKGITTSYAVSQIGIYANDPDEGEVLYAIYQAGTEDTTNIPSEMVRPGYYGEWTFRIKYDQADSVNVTLDPSNAVTLDGMENYVNKAMSPANIKATLDAAEIITTAGTGAAYTAIVPGITELKAGVGFTMIPHVTSTTNKPTLNVNGLGAKNLRQPLTSNTGATTTAAIDTWLTAGKPIRVEYDGTMWKVGIPRPSATYLYGKVPIANGGTDADNAADARSNLGAQAKIKKARVTLSASGWNNSQQTVSVSGVLADEEKCDVIPSADPTSHTAYHESGVYCSAQGDDQLTFACEHTPSVDLTVNVLILK